MTYTVSVSELRNNIADYLGRAAMGTRLLVRDEKRRKVIAQINPVSVFDKQEYEKALKRTAGVFTSKNHPEWNTKEKIIRWLTKSRLADERIF